MLPRRFLWVFPVVLLISAAYSGWLAWQVKDDLQDAEAAARDLRGALDQGDSDARDDAVRDLRQSAGAAEGRTAGLWWGGLAHLPLVGDDVAGVRALSSSLDVLAKDGIPALADTVDLLSGLTSQGRIDTRVLEKMTPPVADARRAFAQAADAVAGVDSSGYAGSVRSRFEDYVDLVTEADRVLGSAKTATEVMPGMIGAEGPRDYLLVFQNNAEIRATGGMPGSWALIHAEDGKLSMGQQGTGGSFGVRDSPVLPMSEAERAVYDTVPGIYFQSSNFTPHFPRAAELWAARVEEGIPGTDLDGVIALDPVALSYLLDGTGPIEVADRTLTSDNAVEELLSRPYLELEPIAQDALFANAARAIFEAATGDLVDPIEFVKGLSRAADEGRFLVAPFVEREQRALGSTRVTGALAGDDGATPHVDIGLNDATASKLSFYLRYGAEVRARSCEEGAQELSGSMSLSQSIPPDAAAKLPDSVTGGGRYGNDPGDQLVFVRLYGPFGGTVGDIRMDGKRLTPEVVDLEGRPVVTLIVQLSTTDDVVINWSMTTAAGQTGDVEVGMTPSVVPGNNDAVVPTAC